MKGKLTREPTAVDLLVPARLTREQVADFKPMVLYAPRRGQAQMVVLDGDGELDRQLSTVLAQMRPRLGPPVWIAVTTDAYVQAEPKAGSSVPRMGLAKKFAEGDMTVVEQMIVVLRHRNRPIEVATQSYRFIPSEGWEWDEPEQIQAIESRVGKVLDHYIV
jgi:hypothetical protein